jgi:hypothetical protein
MVASLPTRREIFARVKRGVVGIAYGFPDYTNVEGNLNGLASIDELYTLTGSGFLAHRAGIVVTAGHVVDPWLREHALFEAGLGPRPHDLCVLICRYRRGNELDFGSWEMSTAYVKHVIRSIASDVAVCFIGGGLDDLGAAPLELSPEPCQEGDEVATCGYPFGLRLHIGMPPNATFTSGIVGAVIPFPGAVRAYRNGVRLDMLINGGNSGGPLFDTNTGRVVGFIVEANRIRVPLGASAPNGPDPVDTVDVTKRAVEIPTGLSIALDIHVAFPYIDMMLSFVRDETSRDWSSHAATYAMSGGRYVGKDFVNASVELEGNEFIGCTFRDCTFVVRGDGRALNFAGNRIKPPWRWVFDGPAGYVLDELKELHGTGDSTMQERVQRLLLKARCAEDPRPLLREMHAPLFEDDVVDVLRVIGALAKEFGAPFYDLVVGSVCGRPAAGAP